MNKKFIVLSACLFAAVLVFTGCPRDRGTPRGETLIVAFAANPAALDPVMTNDQPSSMIMRQIFETLINLDYNLEPSPGLAERWEFENDANGEPTRLRLFLRSGVKFHNGDELTASDVKFSLERASVSPHVGFITDMIKSVEVIDAHEVLVLLEFPFVPFLHHLGHPATSIVSERVVRELGDDRHSQNPVGTGPFKFVNWVAGDRIQLARWDYHHDTPAHLPHLLIRIIVDAATRLIELETGGVDLIHGIQPSDLTRVQNDPNLQLLREMNLATNYIGFNVSRAPFNDVRVRHAIIHAIDLDAMNRAVYMGVGSTATGPINSSVWASAADRLERFEFNPERSRQLLTEAGFPNGFSTTFVTNENPQRIDTGEILQNMLRQVGINVDVRIMEWGGFMDLTARGDHEMYMLGWVAVTGDPDYGLHPVFHSENFGAAGNRSFYHNPEVDRLLDAGRRETDPARREQIYFEVQQIIRDDAPWIFQQAGEEIFGALARVQGFRIHPAGHHRFWTVYFE